MYKILIKNEKATLRSIWEFYGTTSATGTTTTFTEFETDDVNVLQDIIAELDKQIGHENIRVVSDITYKVGVTVDVKTDGEGE